MATPPVKTKFNPLLLPPDYTSFLDRKGRVFITGDKHGNYSEVEEFCKTAETTRDDVLIVLGDNGVNYYGEVKDRNIKKKLQLLPITFIMIRGNHDMRPSKTIYRPQFVQLGHTNGTFLIEDAYPNILFTQEFGWYYIANQPTYVIGGAYSVDKDYRLEMYDLGFHQYRWFANEQLSQDEMDQASKDLLGRKPTWIMSHTCPEKYVPVDMFMSNIDSDSVDRTMEQWLDKIEEKTKYQKWFCGHWHTDRTIDNMRFMYHDIVELEQE